MLKLVPFNQGWPTHDKLDLKAIYRRPRWVPDEWGEMVRDIGPDGLPTWDLTGPLPVRHHGKHLSKGFEYITLADRDSLISAHRAGTVPGAWRDFAQDAQTGGPWHYRKYLAGQTIAQSDAADRLAALVAKYGPETVQDMKREDDPTYALPVALWTAPVTEGAPNAPSGRRGPGRPRKTTEAA